MLKLDRIASGQTVNAASQPVVVREIQAPTQAIEVFKAHGVDIRATLYVIKGLQGPSGKMLTRSFEPGFGSTCTTRGLEYLTRPREVDIVAPLAATESNNRVRVGKAMFH